MAKKLKLWNGRWYPYNGQTVYVAAYSREDALSLVSTIPSGVRTTYFEIEKFWNGGTPDCCWGKAMDGITPERGVWFAEDYNSPPKRLV